MVTKVEATLCISGDDSSDERRNWNINLIQPYQNYELLIVSLMINRMIPFRWLTNLTIFVFDLVNYKGKNLQHQIEKEK